MSYQFNLLMLVVLSLTACTSPVKPEESKQIFDRQEFLAVLEKIGEIEKQTNESNRCANEKEIDGLLKSVCSEGFDGWGSQSYTLNDQNENCKPSKLHPACLQLPQWISKRTSMFNDCGIEYSAVYDVKKLLTSYQASNQKVISFPAISCEKFYDSLKIIQKHCKSCFEEKSMN